MYERLTKSEKKLIRIAKERPELRQKIASYLKKASEDTVVLFLEAVISESEKNRLLSWVSKQDATPSNWAGWSIVSHHMPIQMFGEKGRASDIPESFVGKIGSEVGLKIKGLVANEKAVAVLIEPPSSLKELVSYPHPFITIALNKEGVSPSYVKDFVERSVEKGNVVREDENGGVLSFSVMAKLGYYDGRSKEDTFILPQEMH
jgi:hypothetical protein